MVCWKDIRESQYIRLREAQYLPTKEYKKVFEQMEMESITGPIDDREAWLRHKEAMARRAFAWYRLSKKKDRSKLIDIYNQCALMKGEQNGR